MLLLNSYFAVVDTSCSSATRALSTSLFLVTVTVTVAAPVPLVCDTVSHSGAPVNSHDTFFDFISSSSDAPTALKESALLAALSTQGISAIDAPEGMRSSTHDVASKITNRLYNSSLNIFILPNQRRLKIEIYAQTHIETVAPALDCRRGCREFFKDGHLANGKTIFGSGTNANKPCQGILATGAQ